MTSSETRFRRWMHAVEDDLLEETLRPARSVRRYRSLPMRAAAVLLAVLLAGVLTVNLFPSVVYALESIPVIGPLIRLVDIRTYLYDEDGDSLTLPQPGTEEDFPGAEELNRTIEEETAALLQQFEDYLAARGLGHVGQETVWDILRNDDVLFTLRCTTTLNAGGSGEFSRCLTLDRRTGKVLALSDLFRPDADYITPISENLIEQMVQRRDAGEGDYFVPGGIWSDEECFKSIEPDQNFYLDGEGRLVIVFDEYVVSPGSGGMPEFTIPDSVLSGILADGAPLGQADAG